MPQVQFILHQRHPTYTVLSAFCKLDLGQQYWDDNERNVNENREPCQHHNIPCDPGGRKRPERGLPHSIRERDLATLEKPRDHRLVLDIPTHENYFCDNLSARYNRL